MLRTVRDGDGKWIAAAHLKRSRAKIDRFSLIAMRVVGGTAEAEGWARALAQAGRIEQVEMAAEEINTERPVTVRRVEKSSKSTSRAHGKGRRPLHDSGPS